MIALDLADCLLDEGANTVVAITIDDAIQRAVEAALTGALLDHRLGTQTTEALCATLHKRGVPFLVYAECPQDPREGDGFLGKPVPRDTLVAAMTKALERGQIPA